MDPRDISNGTSCEVEGGAEKALFIVTNVLAVFFERSVKEFLVRFKEFGHTIQWAQLYCTLWRMKHSSTLDITTMGRAGSVVILVVLSFIHKRVRLFRECLWGFPGIVTPLNLLTTTPFRFIYCTIFGAMSGDIMNFKTLYDRFVSPSPNPYVNIFFATVLSPVVVLLYMAAKYFPLFACLEAPIPVVGHILGVIYSCLLVAYNIYDDFCMLYSQWAGRNETVMWIYVASRIPVYMCYLTVTLWYLFNAVYDLGIICFKGLHKAMAEMKTPEHNYYSHYVKQLLRRKEMANRGPLSTCALRVFQYICPYWFTPRKLPLRFIGALSVMLVIALQVTMASVSSLIYLASVTETYVRSNEQGIKNLLDYVNISEAYYDDIVDAANGFSVVFPSAPLISFGFCFILVLHMAASVCKHLQQVARGDFPFTPSFPSIRVSASWRYAGYQVAFFIVALFVYTLILWLLGVIGILIYFGVKYYPETMRLAVAAILIPLGWIGIVFASQVILCKILFIRSGGGKFVVITNKRIFHWFSYTLFIYNAVLGLLMAVVRLLLSSLFSLLLLIRMDRVVLMKGFELWDLGHHPTLHCLQLHEGELDSFNVTGHKAYVGFLYLEHTYNNAVVNVFVKLMMNALWARQRNYVGNGDSSHVPLLNEADAELESLPETSVENDFCGPQLHGDAGKRRSHQARNRWLVAYTLLRNPRLQDLTASRIEEKITHNDYSNTVYGTVNQSGEREAVLAFYEDSPKKSSTGHSAAAAANMTIN